MSQHDPLVALRHVLDHASEAVDLAQGRSRDDLDSDRLLQLALTRLVEIVGEAAAECRRSFKSDTRSFRGGKPSAPAIA